MTRYDPHPQDYDDARTGPQASREAAGRDETASRDHGDGQVLRGALEALADEWDSGLVGRVHALQLRAVLAAHPADAPVDTPTRERMEALIEKSSLGTPEAKRLRDSVPREAVDRIMARVRELDAEAPEPSGDVVAESVVHTWVAPDGWGADTLWYLPEPNANPQPVVRRHELNPDTRHLWPLVPHQAVAEIERRHDDEYDRVLGERDRARATAVALEQEVARLTEDLERVDACADNMTRLHGQAEAEVERLRSWQAEADRRFGSQVRLTGAAEARARRAEDALRRVRDLIPCAAMGCACGGDRASVETMELLQALSAADQTSDATPSDTTEED